MLKIIVQKEAVQLKNIVFIFIHGFGGNIDEVAPLTGFFSRKGYRTISPKLKGHTGAWHDLKGVKYQDWIQSVADEVETVENNVTDLVVIGFSMGGLIALNLALYHRFAAVITINTPIYYWDLKRIVLNLLNDFKTHECSHLQRCLDSSVTLPIGAMLNFKLLLKQTKPIIGEITCPLYVLQGLDDEAVMSRSANYIYERARAAVKRIDFFDHSGHGMLQSAAAESAITNIERFVTELI
jgi:carboxylesterase